jgi:hypothetical protein
VQRMDWFSVLRVRIRGRAGTYPLHIFRDSFQLLTTINHRESKIYFIMTRENNLLCLVALLGGYIYVFGHSRYGGMRLRHRNNYLLL